MRLDKDAVSFDGPVYVACEGDADQYFLCKLLEHYGVTGVDVAVVGGKDNRSTQHLVGLRVSKDFPKLKVVIVVTDNDVTPTERFAAAQKSLRDAGFAVPMTPWTLEKHEGMITTGVVMLPSTGDAGTLETLLVAAILDARPAFSKCLDDLRICAEKPMTWDEVKLAKMRFHASVAALCEDGPGTAASRIWSATHNPVPINNTRFQPLVDFLRSAE